MRAFRTDDGHEGFKGSNNGYLVTDMQFVEGTTDKPEKIRKYRLSQFVIPAYR